jgi:isoquinoline 1-oxidoreductase subunit beta
MSNTITRRDFLKKSLAGTGLVIAVSVSPFGDKIFALGDGKKNAPFVPNVWLQVTPDNIITITVNKSEMGQGVYTSMPMIVADELDADWKKIKMSVAPAADKYKDPVWKRQGTGGSTSVRHMFGPLQKAGAAAREMLVKAAAQTWKISEDDCETSSASVRNKKTGESLTYGELAQKAAKLEVPKQPQVKKAGELRLIGTPVARLDIPSKVGGTAEFGIDVQVKGMLYGTVERPPAYGAKSISYDEKSARAVSGVSGVVPISRGIAVCADTLDAAWNGKKALKTKWDKGFDPGMNNDTLEKEFISYLDKDGIVARDTGDIKSALGEAHKKIESVYLLPYLSHVNMEPMNCTAHVRKDACDVWAPTQNQTGVLETAERITGLKPEKIHVHTTYLGTGFGRRFETDFAEEALEISKATERPVKVIWTREEDMQHDFYRPGNSCRINGGIDNKGNLTAWSHKVVVPSIFARAMPGMVKKGIDPAAVEGIENTPYEIPNFKVEYVRIDTPVPVGFWRSVGNSHNGFTMESFMDEMAHAAGKDPLEFRLSLLKNNPRPRRLLEMVAEKSGWGKPPKRGQALGIAQHFSFGTYVAHAAEVSVNRESGQIRVYKVVCAVDCGNIVNPDTIKAQMEGAIIMGLSAGLKERIEFSGGGVKSANYHNYDILRMSEIPEIEVHIVVSNEALGGIGEPGLPPAAPAVANAVFTATGARLRRLPMRPETVLSGIKNSK